MWERNDADLDDEEHITVTASLNYFLTSRGLTLDDLSVNPVVIGTFGPRLYRHLLRLTGAAPAAHWTEPDRAPLAHGTARGRPVSVILLPIGAPWTVALCETLIAVGARAIIATGAAGSLQESAPIGTLVIPTASIREEGTSYHYAPPELEAVPATQLARVLADGCGARGAEPVRGLNWTTDAPYREMRSKVQRFAARGVVSVDMEASAMFVLGLRRGVEVASLFIVSDELFHPWKPAFQEPSYLERTALAAEIAVDVAGAWAARYPAGTARGVYPAPTH
jgi:uridine phosphorylase